MPEFAGLEGDNDSNEDNDIFLEIVEFSEIMGKWLHYAKKQWAT